MDLNIDNQALIDNLCALSQREYFLNREIEDRVMDARHADITWAEIGTSLGITRQAAQQRFGKFCD
jgi:hypothetical protein